MPPCPKRRRNQDTLIVLRVCRKRRDVYAPQLADSICFKGLEYHARGDTICHARFHHGLRFDSPTSSVAEPCQPEISTKCHIKRSRMSKPFESFRNMSLRLFQSIFREETIQVNL